MGPSDEAFQAAIEHTFWRFGWGGPALHRIYLRLFYFSAYHAGYQQAEADRGIEVDLPPEEPDGERFGGILTKPP